MDVSTFRSVANSGRDSTISHHANQQIGGYCSGTVVTRHASPHCAPIDHPERRYMHVYHSCLKTQGCTPAFVGGDRSDVIETSLYKSTRGQRHSHLAQPRRQEASLSTQAESAIRLDLTAARYHFAASLRFFLQPRPFA